MAKFRSDMGHAEQAGRYHILSARLWLAGTAAGREDVRVVNW